MARTGLSVRANNRKVRFPMSPPEYQPPRPGSEQPLVTPDDGQEEFDADMVYLRGLSASIFEHGSREALMRVAADAPVIA